MNIKIICIIASVFSLSGKLSAQTEIPGNTYSPAGKWIVFSSSGNSFETTKLFVPTFVTDANPFIIKEIGHQLLRFSRRQVYSELFKELLLQTASQDLDFEYGVSKQISAAVSLADGEIKILKALSVATKSGTLFKNLPDQLGEVSTVFDIDARVTKAEGDAISAYASLSAFTESRYELLNNLTSALSYIDPELRKGLSDAHNEVQRMKTQDLETFKNNKQNSALISGSVEEFLKSVSESLFGNLISTIVAGGVAGTSLGTALPAAWFYQLSRGFESEKAEADIVLLSTLDRLIFESQYQGNSSTNKFLLLQMRSHLSFMIKLSADEYYNKVSSMTKDKLPVKTWISGFPYYNVSEFNLLKQIAIKENEINTTQKHTINFTDSEVNYIIKNSEYEFGSILEKGYVNIKLVDGIYKDFDKDICIYLADYVKTKFTGDNNEYLVTFQAGTCGNAAGFEHILIIINSNKTVRKVDAIYSLSKVIINNNSLIVSNFEWEKYDSHCCPTWEIKYYYKWNGKEFKLIKEEKMKRQN